MANKREELEQKVQEIKAQIEGAGQPAAGLPEEEPTAPSDPVAPSLPPLRQRPLISFMSSSDYLADTQPQWVVPLRGALNSLGYLVYYSPFAISSQFQHTDIDVLNALPQRLVKSLCSVFKIQEEVLFPFNHPTVAPLISRAESPEADSDCSILRDLWFLTRSSLILCDLIREPLDPGFAQKLLYGSMLGVPIVGIGSRKNTLDPWIQNSISVLFTDEFNVANILPLVRGYAPLG